MATGRLEAFSDGVFAVAITLLSLDLLVPQRPRHLAHDLLVAWPHYAAYVISFLTIGIIWINHHVMISRLREADHAVLTLNLLLLMVVVVLPFATSLMATYLDRRTGGGVAALVYSGAFLGMALTFAALNRYILLRRPELIEHAMEERQRRLIVRRSNGGLGPYVVATAIGYFEPYAALALTGAVAVFYALPFASGADL